MQPRDPTDRHSVFNSDGVPPVTLQSVPQTRRPPLADPLGKDCLQVVEGLQGRGDVVPARLGQAHEFRACVGWVGYLLHEPQPLELPDGLVDSLSRNTEPARELGCSGAVGIEVGEHQRLCRRDLRPAASLERRAQAVIHPPERPQQQLPKVGRAHIGPFNSVNSLDSLGDSR